MLGSIALLVLSKLAEKNAIDKDLREKEKLNQERKAKLAAISDKRRARTVKASEESFDPTKRKEAEDKARDATRGQLVGQLTAPTQPNVTPLETPSFSGKLSGDELTAQAKATASRTQHGSDYADILSRLTAPQTVALQNALRMNNAGSGSRLDMGRGRRLSREYDERINATRPNSLQMILSNLGQSYAMGSMLGEVTGGAGATNEIPDLDNYYEGLTPMKSPRPFIDPRGMV